MNTRFFYDDCRTQKHLQQATDPGRWVLDMPGPGDRPCFVADPHIPLSHWGANLRTESIALESELQGATRALTRRDCFSKDATVATAAKLSHSEPISYPSCNRFLVTEESRAIMPAWTARELEQVDWYTLPLNPQENTCLPFENNTWTRLQERDKPVNATAFADCGVGVVPSDR